MKSKTLSAATTLIVILLAFASSTAFGSTTTTTTTQDCDEGPSPACNCAETGFSSCTTTTVTETTTVTAEGAAAANAPSQPTLYWIAQANHTANMKLEWTGDGFNASILYSVDGASNQTVTAFGMESRGLGYNFQSFSLNATAGWHIVNIYVVCLDKSCPYATHDGLILE